MKVDKENVVTVEKDGKWEILDLRLNRVMAVSDDQLSALTIAAVLDKFVKVDNLQCGSDIMVFDDKDFHDVKDVFISHGYQVDYNYDKRQFKVRWGKSNER